ncbi:MAG: hypothetical protein VXW31_08510 [Planctomycetota bacterium]|nr:hypothetical protein [Planctomycetota bacterium]
MANHEPGSTSPRGPRATPAPGPDGCGFERPPRLAEGGDAPIDLQWSAVGFAHPGIPTDGAPQGDTERLGKEGRALRRPDEATRVVRPSWHRGNMRP